MDLTFQGYQRYNHFLLNSPSTLGERVRVRGRRDKIKRKNIDKCRKLRRDQAETEKKLWSILRNRQLAGIKVRRQFSIGDYILDFYAPEYNLCIEADGGQHHESKGKQRDEIRERELSKSGVKILRFNDHDVLNNTEGVYDLILKTLKRK
jgi:very-short-patch-repair endonuclease